MRSLRYPLFALGALALAAALLLADPAYLEASSHREAPMILNDPQADNTDVYAYRDPNDPNSVVLVANYIPLELPSGGPNYHQFGEDVRYEIHVKNQTSSGALGSATDDITYRFAFEVENEDPSTFFKIRLGKTNLKASYTLDKSTDGGSSFTTIVSDGFVAPPNVGPKSIEGEAGLNTTYEQLTQQAITSVSGGGGETVFVGPRDDPFFVDLGGAFDLGNFRDTYCDDMSNEACARDEVAGFNTHAIVMRVPISTLQKDGLSVDQAQNILDGDFVIGVWASASRPQIKTLALDGGEPEYSGPWVQVSRLGMPLTNEVIIPIGEKDYWNSVTPYSAAEQSFAEYFVNPELALYMGNGAFASAVPSLSTDLVVQTNSYPALDLDGDGDPDNAGSGLDFTNGADGAFAVFPLIGSGDLDIDGTAFAVPTAPAQAGVPTALIGEGQPRRLDILPIFYFGVPNLPPYQLATGKPGLVANTDADDALEFTVGKPFINNFLPITQTSDGTFYGGDMLRLNMAVPVTDRSSDEFANNAYMGLIRAAAIGLTVPDFATTDLEMIPHMDGFPNGRRLEDDVTTIELQAVGGLVLAAVGLPEDDADAGDYSDLASDQLLAELGFNAGPTENDVPLRTSFPYLADPFNGFSYVRDVTAEPPASNTSAPGGLGFSAPEAFLLDSNYPNPFSGATTVEYHLSRDADVRLDVYDIQGRLMRTLVDGRMARGTHPARFDGSGLASGTYLVRLIVDGRPVQTQTATFIR